MLNSNEPVSMIDITLNDPSSFECTLFQGSGLDGVTVDYFPPSIVENEPYAVDEGYLRACCGFVIL